MNIYGNKMYKQIEMYKYKHSKLFIANILVNDKVSMAKRLNCDEG